MFDRKLLEKAISELSPDSVKQITYLIDMLDGFKDEVDGLTDIASSFELLSRKLQEEKDELQDLYNELKFRMDGLEK